jgi:hypothetical protein
MPDVEIRFIDGKPMVVWSKTDDHITRIEVDNNDAAQTTVYKFAGCALIEDPYTLGLSQG